MSEEKIEIHVSKEERRFIEFCRDVQFCEMRVTVRRGIPIKCYQQLKSIRFDVDTEEQ